MNTPDNFRALVTNLGGPKAVAVALKTSEEVTRQWKHRNSIPGLYWPQVIELAREKNVAVAFEALAAFAQQNREESIKRRRRRQRRSPA